VKEDSQEAEKAETQENTSDLDVQKNAECIGSDGDSSKADTHQSSTKSESVPAVPAVKDADKMDTTQSKSCDNDSVVKTEDNKDSEVKKTAENQSDIDSSRNEVDLIKQENTQEETTDNATKDVTVDNSVEPMDTDEKISQDSGCKKGETKTNIKASEKVISSAEINSSDTSTASKQKSNDKEEKSEKDATEKRSIILISNDSVKRVAASSKNLWVSGLAEKTRANDLKSLFSKFGKVSGAKIVTNAKTPGTRCYGFITMASSEEALICIEKLNHTELHGRIITVEKTTREPSGSIKRADLKNIQAKGPQKKADKT
jgi:RNA recognition motif-containing protein